MDVESRRTRQIQDIKWEAEKTIERIRKDRLISPMLMKHYYDRVEILGKRYVLGNQDDALSDLRAFAYRLKRKYGR